MTMTGPGRGPCQAKQSGASCDVMMTFFIPALSLVRHFPPFHFFQPNLYVYPRPRSEGDSIRDSVAATRARPVPSKDAGDTSKLQ